MKNVVFSILFILLSIKSFCQNDTNYYDSDWNKLSLQQKEEASFYGIRKRVTDSTFLSNYFYYQSGVLYSTQNEKYNLKHGFCQWWYENGLFYCEGNYENDIPIGVHKINLNDDKQLIDYITYRKYKNGEIYAMFDIEDGDTLFDYVEQEPVFIGSKSIMLNSENFGNKHNTLKIELDNPENYPNKCVKRKIEDNVIVGYVIDEKGILKINFVLSDKKNKLLEKAAIELIKQQKEWKPALVDDKPVKYQSSITVKYRLTESQN